MKKIVCLTFLTLAIAMLAVTPVAAQQTPPPDAEQPGKPPPPPDMLGDAMFPPDMIMQHQRELALTDEQKTFMRTEIGKTSARFNDLQWQLHDAMEALGDTMKANQVNEQQAVAQLDKVLDAEREIKKLHMGLAIRIKNALTPEQQEKLQNMRRGRGFGHGHGGPDGPPPRGLKPGRPPGPGVDAPGAPPPRPF
jgi:Spy/CpxP family protein refolding chaperone